MLKLEKGQRVVISGLLIVFSSALKYLNLYPIVRDILLILSAVIAGYPIFLNAYRALEFRILGIEALVTLAVTGAIIIGEFFEAAAVTFLFMLGSYLEAKTLEKTRSSIKELLDLAPDSAKVIRDGIEVEVLPDEVKKGETVVIRPGEKIPIDGIVIEGSAFVNQAPITGEPIPLEKTDGDEVFSGTIIESGFLMVRANKVGEDTTFSRILHLVEEAQDKKAKTQKFLEIFARYYTPSIMALAAIVFLITFDIRLALTLLVIACPGALVISTPVSIVAGIGNGAKHGVLIKGGEIIEKLGTVSVVAFDKTGTLTVGRPKVVKLKGFNTTEDELLRIAAAAEKYSEHPLAKAILEKANTKFFDLPTPKNSTLIPGQGVRAEVEEKEILIGNRKLMAENNLEISIEIEEYLKSEESEGKTAVIVGSNQKILGTISIADELREDAVLVVRELKQMGIKKVVMLTGDNKNAAAYIAKKLDLDEFYAELLPEDKVSILQNLQQQYGRVAMVGDGVNDAPALALSDLGVAMGGVGTDVAMETADVVLMKAELKKLLYALDLSRKTVKNMKQNIYFAIFVVLVLLVGVLAKVVFLSSGMLIHELSVILVILNAIRLLGFKSKF